jgi:histidine triad (HIT) family protein|tara:strand:- start:48 stop:398 length:351 start_codon:yes stop_codon:yes gene_type:complete
MEENCIFCKIANEKSSLQKIIYCNDNFLSIPDANPITDGHTLIISKKHFSTILDMPNTVGLELLDCIKNTSLILMKEKNTEGFNVLQNNFESAGQVVNHVHFHIIPRRKDDGLKIV